MRCAGLKSQGPRALASNSTVMVRLDVDLACSARRWPPPGTCVSASASTLMPSTSQIVLVDRHQRVAEARTYRRDDDQLAHHAPVVGADARGASDVLTAHREPDASWR